MNRIIRIFALIHIPLWILFCLLIIIQLGSSGDTNWHLTALGFILSCLYIFYTHFFILTKYYRSKRKGVYLLRLLGIILTGPLPFIILHRENISGANSITDLYFMILFIPGTIFLFLSWLTRVTHNLILNTIRKEELEKQAVQSELHYLKSQINPHFLFNTLNNIHTLVYKKASTAPQAIMNLSSLMRYMIYDSNAPTVPLLKEIQYLQDYIGLQQLRYQNSSIVDLELEGDLESVNVAPLLFIQLLENAYKHAPASLDSGAIKVKIMAHETNLKFTVVNPVNKNSFEKFEEPRGIGLPNIKKRLSLLYPEQHHLEISNSKDVFSVVLEINNLRTFSHEREDQLLYN